MHEVVENFKRQMEEHQRGVGERLRQLRKTRNWSLARAANELDTTQETVGAWERGEHFPRPSSWDKIEEVYGVSADSIRGVPPLDQFSRIEAKLDAIIGHFDIEVDVPPLELD